MKILLLSRKSPFQIYCANTLFKNGILTDVCVEQGSSFAQDNRQDPFKKTLIFLKFLLHPALLARKIANNLNYQKYYGNQDAHHCRILQSDFKDYAQGLALHPLEDINNDESLNTIRKINPDFVFVFGTRLISRRILEAFHCPVINMHWGWSPAYRGEGIITALAFEGIKALGVTVHHIDLTSDGGDIISQKRPDIGPKDNFYSIGVKLSRLGTGMFIEAFNNFTKYGKIPGVKQDLKAGKLYSQKYMSNHPQLFPQAWERLQKEKSP